MAVKWATVAAGKKHPASLFAASRKFIPVSHMLNKGAGFMVVAGEGELESDLQRWHRVRLEKITDIPPQVTMLRDEFAVSKDVESALGSG